MGLQFRKGCLKLPFAGANQTAKLTWARGFLARTGEIFAIGV
jgi:hypothetical protein